MARPILLAEDSENDAVLIRDVLIRAGAVNPVFQVRDGDEAIAYLRGKEPFSDRRRHPLPGVLLLDLKMPNSDGFAVLEWLRNQPKFHRLLVVVLSGHDGLLEVRRAYDLGAHSFLIKPGQVEDIEKLMRAFTDCWIDLNLGSRSMSCLR